MTTQHIQLDSSEADQTIRNQARYLSSQALATAGRRAINRAARTARSEMSKGVRDRLAIKKRDLDQRMSITRARDTNLEATITIDNSPVSLLTFGAKQISRGVSVRVLKSAGRTLLASAFTVGSIGGEVFTRRGSDRTPIDMLRGPRVARSAEEAWESRAHDAAARIINQRLDHELQRQIDKANR